MGWGACGGLPGVLAASAAATAATVTAARCGCCCSTGWVSGRAITADQRQNRRLSSYPPLRFPCHSSPCLELAAVFFYQPLALQAISLSSNPALQTTHFAGHNWRRVGLLFSTNWLVFYKLARFRERISAPRSWAPMGAILFARTHPAVDAREITWRCAPLLFPFFSWPSRPPTFF
eukprot:COSAG01_NODE_364_length_18090_cov_40.740870_1_plen_176_part_00